MSVFLYVCQSVSFCLSSPTIFPGSMSCWSPFPVHPSFPYTTKLLFTSPFSTQQSADSSDMNSAKSLYLSVLGGVLSPANCASLPVYSRALVASVCSNGGPCPSSYAVYLFPSANSLYYFVYRQPRGRKGLAGRLASLIPFLFFWSPNKTFLLSFITEGKLTGTSKTAAEYPFLSLRLLTEENLAR